MKAGEDTGSKGAGRGWAGAPLRTPYGNRVVKRWEGDLPAEGSLGSSEGLVWLERAECGRDGQMSPEDRKGQIAMASQGPQVWTLFCR